MDFDRLLRQHRKKLLIDPQDLDLKLDLGSDAIKKIIPHREPLLLIDRLTGISLEDGVITGARYLNPEDPVFTGHFPGYPVYPGVLEVEMLGQLGLCLHYFSENQTDIVSENAEPVRVRATRVVGAYYLEPLLPGFNVLLIAKKLESDGIFAKVIGQAVADGKICCVAINEGCLLG